MPVTVPEWQLPPGVTRGLWDYLHDPRIARQYDEYLAGSTLFSADQAFAERYFHRPGRLIDLGCGTGRTLLSFAHQGFWVLGVDLSEEMLRVTSEKAGAAGVVVQLLKANLVELDSLADQSFDYATCLFSTLGMVEGAEQRGRLIAHIYRLLRPGGKFILHVHNRWFNFWDPQGRRWLVKDWFRSILGRREAGNRVMPVHQGIAGLTLHLFTRREVVRLLRRSGFRILEVQPVGLGPDGRLAHSWWFQGLRSYGYLLAAERVG
jgi:ubiquinone/menaquinone biosynthesis C-methylase UbiE